MAKHLILAVAGSGKTSYLIGKLDIERRFLILTYTINNCDALRARVCRKFGYMPNNISIYTYFSFLYSFCFMPFLKMIMGAKGVIFEECQNRYARGDGRYITSNGWLYSNRLARLLQDRDLEYSIGARIEKYFDVLMIDEVQDFGGHDFNFLISLVTSCNVDMHFVGDFFQHTFDTSRDGNVNESLHDDLETYAERFKAVGFVEDKETLSRSYRCSPTVCGLVQTGLEISIQSHRSDVTEVLELSDTAEIEKVIHDENVIKLFYQDSRKYPVLAKNWGESKGDDHFQDVCVVLNDSSMKKYRHGDLASLPKRTKNKLYVALTRTRGRLYLVPEKAIKHYKAKRQAAKL